MIVFSNLIKSIDWLLERIGRGVAVLAVTLMLIMTYEVISRYVFNAPTFWSYDILYMMSGTFYLFSAPYLLRLEGHVRVDIFYARFSSRAKKFLDLTLTLILFFPAISVLVYQAWKFAFRALAMGETSMGGIWEPTVVPYRFIIAVGFSLLALAVVTWFLRDLSSLVIREELDGKSHD